MPKIITTGKTKQTDWETRGSNVGINVNLKMRLKTPNVSLKVIWDDYSPTFTNRGSARAQKGDAFVRINYHM